MIIFTNEENERDEKRRCRSLTVRNNKRPGDSPWISAQRLPRLSLEEGGVPVTLRHSLLHDKRQDDRPVSLSYHLPISRVFVSWQGRESSRQTSMTTASASWITLGALVVSGASARCAIAGGPARPTAAGEGDGCGRRSGFSAELKATAPVVGADAGGGDGNGAARVMTPGRNPSESTHLQRRDGARGQHQQERHNHHHQREQQQDQHQQQQQHRGRRQLQSCSGLSEYAYTFLTDIDRVDPALSVYEFRCTDGEFLVGAELSVEDHEFTERRETYNTELVQYIRLYHFLGAVVLADQSLGTNELEGACPRYERTTITPLFQRTEIRTFQTIHLFCRTLSAG